MGLGTVKIKGADQTANPGALAQQVLALAGPGRLFFVTVTSTNAAQQWIHIFDSAAAPAANAVPLISVPVPSGNIASIDLGLGRPFVNGIFVGNSTNVAQYVAGAADCLIDVLFTAGIGQV